MDQPVPARRTAVRTRRFGSFDELPAEYVDFLARIERQNFFCGLGWFKNFSKTALEPGATAVLYAVEDGGSPSTPRLVLPTRTPAGQNGSVLAERSPGPGSLASMTNYQSVFFAPAVAENEPDLPSIVDSLVETMCAHGQAWTLIDLNLLNPASPATQHLASAFREAGMIVRRYVYNSSRYECVEGRNFAEYLRDHESRRHKPNVGRHKKLKKLGDIRFELTHGGEELERKIRDYERVQAASWKEPEPFPDHAAGVIRAGAAANALRLGILYLSEQPIAAHIWIVSGGTATIYKIHYDQSFGKYSPGGFITPRMFEHVIDQDRVEEINFGVGDEPHKRAWLHDKRDLVGLIAFNPRTMTGARVLCDDILRHIGSRMKRSLRRAAKPVYRRLDRQR